MNLHSWLRRTPTPSSLRFDNKKTVLIGEGKAKWRDALLTIESLQPALVEALDANGNVIRVAQLTQDTETEQEAEDRKKSSRDVDLAKIIMEAGDRGAARHADAYSIAFTKMTELVQVLADRMTGLEGAWQETLNQLAEAKTSGGGGSEDGSEMISNVLSLAAAKQASEDEVRKQVAVELGKQAAKSAAKKKGASK